MIKDKSTIASSFMDDLEINIKVGSSLQSCMDRLTGPFADTKERIKLREELLKKVSYLPPEEAREFIEDNSAYFSDEFKESLLSCVCE